jgi:hypothetical protein
VACAAGGGGGGVRACCQPCTYAELLGLALALALLALLALLLVVQAGPGAGPAQPGEDRAVQQPTKVNSHSLPWHMLILDMAC